VCLCKYESLCACIDVKPPAVTVNGSVDDATAATCESLCVCVNMNHCVLV